jgi:hypothetical protein
MTLKARTPSVSDDAALGAAPRRRPHGDSLNGHSPGAVPNGTGAPVADGFGVPARRPMPMATQSLVVWTPTRLAVALGRWTWSQLTTAAPTVGGASTGG